jgi:hypothetical protein
MSRRQAFINTRKFFFLEMFLTGVDRRKAYAIATKRAAESVFHLTTRSLTTVSLPVW